MKFSLLGLPVQIDWGFWIVAALLGGDMRDANLVLIWVAVVLFSVLLHECGHALAAIRLGARPRIHLTMFGGMTMWSPTRSISAHDRLGVSVAGPLAGFAAAALITLLVPFSELPAYMARAFSMALWVNVVWGVLNLLPILPLDGGHAMREIISILRGKSDERLALKISAITGALLAFLAVSQGYFYGALLAGWMTWRNWSAYKNLTSPQGPWA
jgi:membrane-associated protease RseP (regulator of RpoE activity)